MLTLLVVVALAAILAAPARTARAVVIHVNDDAAPGGNGTSRAPYGSLADALAAADATSAAVVIKVAPGNYAISSSLVVDRPLELRGSSVLIQGADGWPTGDVVAGTETRLFASYSTLPQVIRVGGADSSVLSDVTISGFVFEGTTTGVSTLLNRVQNFLIADNVYLAPAFIALQTVASSGAVKGNHFSGVATGAVFTGGYPASPSNVVASGNRSVGNTLGGMLLNGASINIPELGDQLNATVRDNDLSGNTAAGQGFGLRVFILRRDIGAPGDTQSSASVTARLMDNRIHGNRNGIVIDAGFPYRRVGTVCDSRPYSGTVDLELDGNSLESSLQTPALVTFTRNQSAVNPSLLPQWGYLHAAHFAITDKDGTLEDAWIDNPATDPFVGPCPGDTTNEPLGNVLLYNGVILPTGRNF